LLAMLVRSDLSKDVELLVLPQEDQVLRRQAGGHHARSSGTSAAPPAPGQPGRELTGARGAVHLADRVGEFGPDRRRDAVDRLHLP